MINKVIIVGNLGRDPEVRNFEGGSSVASFSVATSESYVDKKTNEKKTNTEWHNVALWGGLAGVAEKYLKKGSQVYIEGSLRTRKWQDKDGNDRYTTEIVGRTMKMLGAKDGGNSNYTPPQSAADAPVTVATPNKNQSVNEEQPAGGGDDDLPF